MIPLYDDPYWRAIQSCDVDGVLLGTSPVKNTGVGVNSNVERSVLSILIGHNSGYLGKNRKC